MKMFFAIFGLMLSLNSSAQSKIFSLRCQHSTDTMYDRHSLQLEFNSWQNRADFYFGDSRFNNTKEMYIGNDLRSVMIRLQGEIVHGRANPNAKVEILLTSPTEILKRGARIQARVRHSQTDAFSWSRSEEYLECHQY